MDVEKPNTARSAVLVLVGVVLVIWAIVLAPSKRYTFERDGKYVWRMDTWSGEVCRFHQVHTSHPPDPDDESEWADLDVLVETLQKICEP